MKRVAYSNITRLIAFLVMEFLVIVSMILGFYFGHKILDVEYIKEGLSNKSYWESDYFKEQMVNTINNANYFLECQKDFEVSGEYNGNKLVSISDFLDTKQDISLYSQNQVYKLQDLIDWSQEPIETVSFEQLLRDMGASIDSKIDLDREGSLNSAYDSLTPEEDQSKIKDEVVKINMMGDSFKIPIELLNSDIIKEAYFPFKDSDLVTFGMMNGFFEIKKTSDEIQDALKIIALEYSFYKNYETFFKGIDSSNFKIYIKDSEGNTIINNCLDEKTDYLSFFKGDAGTKIGGGIIFQASNKEFNFTNGVNYDVSLDLFKIPDQTNYIYAVGVDAAFPHSDVFYEANKSFQNGRNNLIILAFSMLFIVINFFYLVLAAGRKAKDEVIYLNSFDRIKTEIGAGIMLALGVITFIITYQVYNQYNSDMPFVVGVGIEAGLFTLGFLSLVKRVKAGQVWKNSVFYSTIVWIILFVKHRKVTTKVTLMYTAFLLITLGLILTATSNNSIFWLFLWFAFSGVIGFFLLREAIARQSVLNGIKKISDGDLEFKIDVDEVTGANETLANAINNIGEGLHNAVDASVRNERLKTDLITNVSHDIKTPLTSIINYVDLLKRENIEDEKIRGYIEVLDNKSQRLKNLTEDLVEASKISSGNIKLEMSTINFVELINQTEGELSEKFEAKGLQIIKSVPLDPVFILADGRRMWRVIENLYNNVAKYAMPNTRVYVDIKAENHKVSCSIKNISENPLNINANELTERFIRGDVSRSTEGSGLGLSIAKNLTTLQKGDFDIYLDGDLFKVTIMLPQVDEDGITKE